MRWRRLLAKGREFHQYLKKKKKKSFNIKEELEYCRHENGSRVKCKIRKVNNILVRRQVQLILVQVETGIRGGGNAMRK